MASKLYLFVLIFVLFVTILQNCTYLYLRTFFYASSTIFLADAGLPSSGG